MPNLHVNGNQGVCWEKLVNELPMHAQIAQEGTLQTNILCCTLVLHVYIVWCQLTHLHEFWRHFLHVYTNVRLFVTRLYEFHNIT